MDTNADFKRRKLISLVVSPLLIMSAFAIYSIVKQETVTIAAGIIGAAVTFIWNWRAYRVNYRKLVKMNPIGDVVILSNLTL